MSVVKVSRHSFCFRLLCRHITADERMNEILFSPKTQKRVQYNIIKFRHYLHKNITLEGAMFRLPYNQEEELQFHQYACLKEVPRSSSVLQRTKFNCDQHEEKRQSDDQDDISRVTRWLPLHRDKTFLPLTNGGRSLKEIGQLQISFSN